MLLGEKLGRRHERGLRPRAGRDPRGERRDDGLPRAHVAFEQAGHRHALSEVPADLSKRFLLRPGEREGQLADPPRKLRVWNGERER